MRAEAAATIVVVAKNAQIILKKKKKIKIVLNVLTKRKIIYVIKCLYVFCMFFSVRKLKARKKKNKNNFMLNFL